MSIIEGEPVVDRDAWLEARRGAIGSSDMASILGLSPYSTPWEVWAEKTGRLTPWKGSKSTRAGTRLEDYVLDHAEAAMGELQRNVRMQHGDLPIAATLDARSVDSHEPVEAKTTGIVGPVIGSWGEALTDQIPEHYIIQVQTQMIVTGAEVAHLFALIGGRGVVRFMVPRSDRLCEHLIDTTVRWWHEHIEMDTPPDMGEVKLDVVKRLIRKDGKEIELQPIVTELVAEWEAAKKAKGEAEKYADAVQARILNELGDAEIGRLSDGTFLSRTKISKAGHVVPPCTYYTLYHKKAKKK